MSCKKHIVLFSVDTTGEIGDQLGSDETDIAALTWQVLDVARNQAQPVQRKLIKPRAPFACGKALPCGIQAGELSGAEDLSRVLTQFQSDVDKLGSFGFVVNGPLPLRQCLHPEAIRNKISLPGYLYTYFDLVKEVTKCVPNVPPGCTLKDIASILGLSTAGLLCGKGEVEAMCCITQKLVSQGHMFSLAETIDPKCDFHASLNVATIPSKSTVRLRGLPFQATFEDVAGFMAGLNIVPGGIVFGISAVGRRTGEAIVVLQDTEHTQLALKRHRHYLNQRYIEVYEASAEDFVQFAGNLGVGKEMGTQDSSGACVVRLQGLPYRATQQEIVQFFSDAASVNGGEAGVFVVRYPDGRASGDAFVLFSSESEVERAMTKNKQPLGHRYVDIFKSTSKELEMVLSKSATEEQLAHFTEVLGISAPMADHHHGMLRGVEKNCVKLRGLPWSTTSEQVVDFFGSELQKEIVSQGVHMLLNGQNRPTGDCYVQLKTAEAAKEASETLHKQHMGTRYIEVFQCTGDEVAQALMHMGAGAGRGGGAFRGRKRKDGGGGGGGASRGGGGNTVKARGLPYSTTAEEIADFFCDYSVDGKDVEIVYDNFERPTGVAFVSFSTPGLAQQAIREKNGQNIGRRYIELSLS